MGRRITSHQVGKVNETMNSTTAKDQEVWNNGFDYFFEWKEEQKLSSLEKRPSLKVWMDGFVAASGYCEHLLKEARGENNV